jgi:hypothetical protein
MTESPEYLTLAEEVKEQDQEIKRLRELVAQLRAQAINYRQAIQDLDQTIKDQEKTLAQQRLVIKRAYEDYEPELDKIKGSMPLVYSIIRPHLENSPIGALPKRELVDRVFEEISSHRLAYTSVTRILEYLADPKHTGGKPLLKRHGTKAALYSLTTSADLVAVTGTQKTEKDRSRDMLEYCGCEEDTC